MLAGTIANRGDACRAISDYTMDASGRAERFLALMREQASAATGEARQAAQRIATANGKLVELWLAALHATGEAVAATPVVSAFCMKCRDRRVMDGPRLITMKNGKPATSGACPVCGTRMFRIGAA